MERTEIRGFAMRAGSSGDDVSALTEIERRFGRFVSEEDDPFKGYLGKWIKMSVREGPGAAGRYRGLNEHGHCVLSPYISMQPTSVESRDGGCVQRVWRGDAHIINYGNGSVIEVEGASREELDLLVDLSNRTQRIIVP